MKLKKLTVENFKGIRSFSFEPDGKNCNISADNRFGKTTVGADSIFWLLFDKDSLNQTKFDIKPLDEKGEPIHNIENTVEGQFVLNEDKVVTLKKSHYELWQKRRGSRKQEFSGHTKDYFIDGVPKSEKEYKEFVSSICDESKFKLLTNPRFFNEVLHWKERRDLLFEVFGTVTDQEVVDSSKKLNGLIEILDGKTTEDHKEMVAARIKKINDEIKKIPIRIDEATRNLTDEPRESAAITSELEHSQGLKKQAQRELDRLSSGGDKTLSLRSELSDINLKISNEKTTAECKANEEWSETSKKIAAAKNQLDNALSEKESLERRISEADSNIEKICNKIASLAEDWKTIKASEFVFSESETCPTCGQDLPADQVQDARDKALGEFNTNKSELLEKNVKEGTEESNRRDALKKIKAEFIKSLSEISDKIKTLQDAFGEIDQTRPEPKYSQAYSEACRREEEILSDIKKIEDAEDNASAVSAQKEKIGRLEAVIDKLESELRAIDQNQKTRKRIDELSSQEKALSEEYERLENELMLIENFTRAKVAMLDEKINGQFTMAKFKLFEEQINGGLNECCTMTVNGVPYGSLNNAAKTQAGCDIINTLQRAFGLSLFVVIDNRESITTLPEMDCQVISLVVVPGLQELKVEIQD